MYRFTIVLLLLAASAAPRTLGAAIDDLRAKINERGSAIAALEKEIAAYQDEIERVGKETQTLQSAIRAIDLEEKRIAAKVRLTENQIQAANLAIIQLSSGIIEKGTKIVRSEEAIAHSLRSREQLEARTLVETLLRHETLSTFSDALDSLRRFESGVADDLASVRLLKAGLEEERSEAEAKRAELAVLKSRLADERQALLLNRSAKNALLAATKNKESEYKKQLAAKVARRNAFEQELLQFESELRFEIDPSSLPTTGTGVLKWPLESVKITQYFGNTAFAKAGAYNGAGHNGIDLRASVGTPVKAALAGVVKGAGNTDAVCPGASYGKWVLIEHGNGLSTLYAHFSLIKVSLGQSVGTGEVIGYSGETGYATGPHLHFTVYATQGVRILERKSSVCRGNYTMPVADLKAYLNPLLYL